MKAAAILERPAYALMKQSDVQSFYHFQMPRWLFSDPRYTALSLEAKVAYTFLLNRFQLSRLNGWVNDAGEVFIIYTRASLAEEMQVSYYKVMDAMKQLSECRLIWERRCGRGAANQIYLARVEPGEDLYGSAPFVDKSHEAAGARPVDITPLAEVQTPPAQPAEPPPRPPERQDVPEPQVKRCGIEGSRRVDSEGQEVRNPDPSDIDISLTDFSEINVSQSVGARACSGDGQAGETDLDAILEGCELWTFSPELAGVFKNAIERLYFSEEFRIGRALLPKSKVRSHLHELDCLKLQAAEAKLRRYMGKEVKNSTAYVMAVIFNCIWETESDLLVDPYLNSLNQPLGGVGGDGL